MIARGRVQGLVMVTLLALTPAVKAQTDAPAPPPSRPRLLLQLSEALRSFDRGSALLRTAPDEALAALRVARDKFRAVADAGVENGPLYYNLGNTHLRLGEIGQAIACYRRAERLVPTDQRLQANLQFARSLCRNRIEASGKRTFLRTVFAWHYESPPRLRMHLAMIGYGLFWLLLAAKALMPRIRLGYAALACLVVWVALAVSVAVDRPSRAELTEGVLIANDVIVRKGNGETYDPQFSQPLHEGVEFAVLEQRGGWIRIELPDENQGWVREREVALF